MDPEHCGKEMGLLLRQLRVRRILLVCGRSFYRLPVRGMMETLDYGQETAVTYYQDFSPNPKYEDILGGVEVFRKNGCDCVVAVGGGSAIDVAKGIKLLASLDRGEDYLKQEITANEIPLFAVPTTAGSGSEATRFAVFYRNGNKHAIEHESALPQYVLLYPDNLLSLPDYQKKATLCDALSHAVESYWSLRSSAESRKLSEKAMCMVLDSMEDYLENNADACKEMLSASNLAGQAINMTKTTAAHAMCYQLTTVFGISHGHAVMLCLPEVWKHMEENLDRCIDKRGQRYLRETLNSLAHCLKQDNPDMAIRFLQTLRSKFGFSLSRRAGDDLAVQLADSVDAERLGNFPVMLTRGDLYRIYSGILGGC